MGRYRIEREIGHGAMAIVYLAIQEDLDRPVALKVLTDTLAHDHEFVNRFLNEARAAAALTHPKIVQAYDAGFVEPDLYYFVMELIRGETLYDRIRRERMLKVHAALGIAIDIAEALNYGWTRQMLVHGDIKPENIMISDAGETKLADFGLAKVSGHDYSGRGIMLTPLYAAPEIIRGEKHPNDCRADIYSFGATLFHALAGQAPFPGTDAQIVLKRHLEDPIPALAACNPKVSKELSDFVADLLAKNAAARPQNWEQVLASLEWFHHRRLRTAPGPVPAAGERPGRSVTAPATPTRRSTAAVWFWAALFVILTVIGVIVVQSRMPARRGTPPLSTAQEQALAEWQQLKLQVAAETDVFAGVEHLEQYRRNHPGWVPADFAQTLRDYHARITARNVPRKPEEKAAPGKTAGSPAVPPATVPGKDHAAASSQPPPPPPQSLPVAHPPPVVAPPPPPPPPPPSTAAPAAVAPPPAPAAAPPAPVTALARADAYTDLTADIFQNLARFQNNLEPVMQAGKEWLARFAGASEERERVLFLIEKIIPAYDEFLPKLIAHKERTLGNVLPVKKYAGRPVKNVTLTELILTEKTDYGEVTVRMPWGDVDRVAVLAALGKLAFDDPALAPADRYAFMAFLLFNRQIKTLADQISQLPDSGEKRLWLLLQNDMTRAEVEGKALAAWRDAQQAAARGEFRRAYRALQELRSTQSAVAYRYASAEETLQKACALRVPELQAQALLERAQQALAAQPAEALALLNTVLNRYGRMALPELKDVTKLRTKALDQLQEKFRPPSGPVLPAFLPLLNLVPQAFPGQSMLQYRQVQELEDLPPAVKKHLPALSALCLLEMGDWLGARPTLGERTDGSPAGLPIPLQASLHVGRALIGARFEDSALPPATAFTALAELQSGFGANDPTAGFVLARIGTDLALLTRTWEPTPAPWPATDKLVSLVRVPGCLPLVFSAVACSLEAGRRTDVEAFFTALRTQEQPKSDPEKLCLAVGEFLLGNTARPPQTTGMPTFYQELYQRFVVSAALSRPPACQEADGRGLWNDLAAHAQTDSLIGASAWFDVILLQVGGNLLDATAQLHAVKTVDEALNRTSAGVQAHYPRLRFLEAGLELLRGAPEMARETLAMVSLATVASRSELQTATVLDKTTTPADADKGAGPATGSADGVFWSQWLYWAQAVRDGRPAVARAAVDLMQRNAATAAQRQFVRLLGTVPVAPPAVTAPGP